MQLFSCGIAHSLGLQDQPPEMLGSRIKAIKKCAACEIPARCLVLLVINTVTTVACCDRATVGGEGVGASHCAAAECTAKAVASESRAAVQTVGGE
jgi:hypothetical protein